MKKIISSFIIIIILFNFISSNIFCVFAADGSLDPGRTESKDMEKDLLTNSTEPSDTVATDIMEEGEVSKVTGGTDKAKTGIESAGLTILGTVTGVIALVIDLFIFTADLILGQLTSVTEEDKDGNQNFQFFFSLERTVFNRIPLFDVNYFDIEEDVKNKTYTVGTKESETSVEVPKSKSINDIKIQVSLIYQITRILAMMIGLLVLIYVGIRMALSAVASDKAKYKKMLVSWVESIVLLFVIPYIIVAIIGLGNMFTNMFFNIEQALIAGGDTFETTVRNSILKSITSFSGLNLTIWSITYGCLIFIELKFFWLYIKRTLMVGFLVAISPLITITYALDKVGDGRAQAFATWFKEITVNILIQPLHALIYMVFILTANEIAAKSPLLSLLFLLSMGNVEKMVKAVFNLKGLVTLKDANQFMKKE